jgi:CubicO group peptidase (beta-lactamase class C family)
MRRMTRGARRPPLRAPSEAAEESLAHFFATAVEPGQGPWASAAAAVETVGERRLWATPGSTLRHDLASLTKPFVATLALVLDREGRLSLGLPVGEILGEATLPLARRSLEDLLRHRAGLQPWAPLPRLGRTPETACRALAGGRFGGAAPGTYSDLGYILWGLAAERALGAPLAALLDRLLLAPLGLAGRVAASPGTGWDAIPILLDNRRERELARALGIPLGHRPPPPPGVPQDGNARWLGGLAGHAGLFGDVESLLVLGREWLAPGRVLDAAQVARALSGRGPYALGWARRRVRGSAGPALSSSSFGHTGFTGCSLWLDPERRLLLAVAGHRRGFAPDLNPWRRRFHALGVTLGVVSGGEDAAA